MVHQDRPKKIRAHKVNRAICAAVCVAEKMKYAPMFPLNAMLNPVLLPKAYPDVNCCVLM
jgi:hypothetical protein